MSEAKKNISLKIEIFETRPDERGYLTEFNKMTLLEANTVDSIEERVRLLEIAQDSLKIMPLLHVQPRETRQP